ncbi:MAG: hypothetical protein KGL39_53200 [Patescibacteria group bacterium]|nr:hypothetical protein [Patescibacteria group bacterium]
MTASKRVKLVAVAVLVALVGAAAAAIISEYQRKKVNAPQAAPTALPGASKIWMISSSAYGLLSSSTSGQALAQKFFDSSRSIIVVGSRNTQSYGGASLAFYFTGFADFKAKTSIAATSGAEYAVFDDENWKYTPPAEQKNTDLYFQKFSNLAQQYGLKVIASPSPDLANALPRKTSYLYSDYLSDTIAGSAAKWSDVFDIQAQGLQSDPQKYASFVAAVAQQVKKINPGIEVIASLSTNPSSHAISPQTLLDDVRLTAGTVDGYWLNIPQKSACPSCGATDPQAAVRLLSLIEKENPSLMPN